MDTPILPTDNLYKFLAIAGLTIFVASGWLSISSMNTLMNEVRVDYVQIKGLAKESELIQDKIKVDPSLRQKFEVRLDQIEIEKTKMDAENEIFSYKVNDLKSNIKWFLLPGLCIGFLIMAFGFKLWYQKLQKYEDERVKQKRA